MDIKDKVVLITGASEGIGLATARRFAEAGAKLSLVARSADKLEVLADELEAAGAEAIAVPADVSDAQQAYEIVEKTAQHFGGLDVLINNAGQAAVGMVADINPELFQQIIDLNIFGPLIAMQAAVPIMRGQGGGLIINVSSMVSKMRIPTIGAYAATKAALNMLSDTARGELASDNIRVITVLPRMTKTDFAVHSLGRSDLHQHQHSDPSVPVDSAEHVANRILDAAINEPEEQYMDR
jgi:short-subunit dehydrogenase